MDVDFAFKERKKKSRDQTTVGTGTSEYVTGKGGPRQSGHVKRTNDIDWIKHCKKTDRDGIQQIIHLRRHNVKSFSLSEEEAQVKW